MAKRYKSKRTLLQILILFLLFSFVKLAIETEFITSINEEKNYKSPKYFKVDLGNNIPNYIKVQIEGNEDYAIIYYKDDSTFKYINQFVKSSSNKAIMWLKQSQINKTFYLSVICSKESCNYKFKIEPREKLELELGQLYTYYVTDETRTMNFSINGIPILQEGNPNGKLSIWAKGYQKITSELKSESKNMANELKRNKDGIEVYLIPVQNNVEFNIIFKVDGIPGDLINIGVLLFNNENICQTPIKDLGNQISGLLIKNYMEKSFFIFPGNEKPNINTPLKNEASTNFEAYNHDNKNIYSINMNSNLDENFNDNFLYSFQYNINEEKQNNTINIYSPLELGKFHEINMIKGQNIGLVPKLTNGYFEYLTYKILEKKGKFKAYILNCENYPLCKRPENPEYLINYNAVSRTFSNYSFNTYSTINNNQTMMIIECESDFCLINANIYTENNKTDFESLISYQNYQIGGVNEKLTINSIPHCIVYIYFNTPSTSSRSYLSYYHVISAHEYYWGEFYFYEIIEDKKFRPNKDYFDYSFEIRENLIYSVSLAVINKNDTDADELTIYPGMYYVLLMNNNKTNDTIVKTMNPNQKDKNDGDIYYLTFYSSYCYIEANRLPNGENKYILNDENEIYYYFYDISNNNNEFKITKSEKSDCSVHVSLFKYKNFNNELNSIFLYLRSSHIFVFDQNNNEVKYRYLLDGKHKEIEIKIDLTNLTKCNISSLYINDNETLKDIALNPSITNSIKLLDDLINNCKDYFQPCKIEFTLFAEEIKENSFVEVQIKERNHKWPDVDENPPNPPTPVNPENPPDKPPVNPPDNPPVNPSNNPPDNNNKKLYLILGIILGSVLLIVIIIIVIFVCKTKNSFDELQKKVNSISYVEDKDKDNNAQQDLLE